MKLSAMPKLRQVLESILAAMNLINRRQFACIPSSLGVPGVPWHTQNLADQLTLFQPGGDRLCPPNYYWHTQSFRPSDVLVSS